MCVGNKRKRMLLSMAGVYINCNYVLYAMKLLQGLCVCVESSIYNFHNEFLHDSPRILLFYSIAIICIICQFYYDDAIECNASPCGNFTRAFPENVTSKSWNFLEICANCACEYMYVFGRRRSSGPRIGPFHSFYGDTPKQLRVIL